MKPAHPEDPMELVGVCLDGGPDDAALTEMAWCFVEEFVRMGWSSDRIMRMFRSPAYRGPHQILHAKGEEFVRQIIDTMEEMRRKVQSADGG